MIVSLMSGSDYHNIFEWKNYSLDMLDKNHIERFDQIRDSHFICIFLILFMIFNVESFIKNLILDCFILLYIFGPSHDHANIP